MKRANWLGLGAVGVTVAVCLLAGVIGAAAAAEIYKWVDENGITHYSNVRPKGARWTRVTEDKVSIISGTRIGAEAARAADREAARTAVRESARTNQDTLVVVAPSALSAPSAGEQMPSLSERREVLMQDCLRNHGVDCAREVDAQLRAEGNLYLRSGPRAPIPGTVLLPEPTTAEAPIRLRR